MIGQLVVDGACWLLTVDLLGELAVQECVFDIKLVHRPLTRRDEVENSAYCRRLDH